MKQYADINYLVVMVRQIPAVVTMTKNRAIIIIYGEYTSLKNKGMCS